MQSFSFNARVYFLVINNLDQELGTLFEAYRISTSIEITINKLGRYEKNNFYDLTKKFIWERRNDLKGHQFGIVALPNIPFLNYDKSNKVNHILIYLF